MRIAFGIELMWPDCPIVQAALGSNTYAPDWFDPEDWLLAPNAAMRVCELSDAGQIAQLRHKLRTARLTTLTTEPTRSSPGSS
jgi:hypothetical protein